MGRLEFVVYVRCISCQVDHPTKLSVPLVLDAPTTVDELLESNFLASQRFECRQCDSPIGVVTAVKGPSTVEAA